MPFTAAIPLLPMKNALKEENLRAWQEQETGTKCRFSFCSGEPNNSIPLGRSGDVCYSYEQPMLCHIGLTTLFFLIGIGCTQFQGGAFPRPATSSF